MTADSAAPESVKGADAPKSSDAAPAAPTTTASPTPPQPAATPAAPPPKPTVAAAAPSAQTASAVAEPAESGPKPIHIKEKRPTQRACDEKNEKGKLCCGHLKRWYDYPAEVEKLIGKGAEIYRCEFCQTLYTPDLAEMPHSYTLRY